MKYHPVKRRFEKFLSFSRWGWIGVVLLFITACKHPIDYVTSHVDVSDLIVRDMLPDTGVIARTYTNNKWEGTISLHVNQERYLRITLIDFKGNDVLLDDRDDVGIRLEVENPTLVQWEPWTGYGILRGFTTGTTRIRFLVWHGSHPDFITPWLPIEIASEQPSAL